MSNDEYINEEFEDEEQDLKADPKQFGEAVIWSTDWTTETINNQMVRGNIDLSPRFQRRDAWNDKEKSRLIESLMLGLPVPPIILAEIKGKRNAYLVIDGKQRLLSIRRFYAETSKDDGTEKSFQVLKLSGLDILPGFNGFTHDNDDPEFQEYVDGIDNQPIRTIVIRNWPNEAFLYTVFLRLNTGSKKLSAQELRQALKPGPFLDFLDEATSRSKTLQKMLHNNGPDKRMKDIELALRFYAFKYNILNYNGNLKNFLDDICDELNHKWNEKEIELKENFQNMEQAIEFAYKYIDPKSPFSRTSKPTQGRVFNRSVFELFTFYFSDAAIQELVKSHIQKFKSDLESLYQSNEFIQAVSNTTKKTDNVVTRFHLFSKVLKGLDNHSLIYIPDFAVDNSNRIVEK